MLTVYVRTPQNEGAINVQMKSVGRDWRRLAFTTRQRSMALTGENHETGEGQLRGANAASNPKKLRVEEGGSAGTPSD